MLVLQQVGVMYNRPTTLFYSIDVIKVALPLWSSSQISAKHNAVIMHHQLSQICTSTESLHVGQVQKMYYRLHVLLFKLQWKDALSE